MQCLEPSTCRTAAFQWRDAEGRRGRVWLAHRAQGYSNRFVINVKFAGAQAHGATT